MTICYRFYTEDRPEYRERIDAVLLSEGVDGYTLIPATGIWGRETEPSLIVEWITDDDGTLRTAKRIAAKIRTANEQQSVLLTWYLVEAEFVTA